MQVLDETSQQVLQSLIIASDQFSILTITKMLVFTFDPLLAVQFSLPNTIRAVLALYASLGEFVRPLLIQIIQLTLAACIKQLQSGHCLTHQAACCNVTFLYAPVPLHWLIRLMIHTLTECLGLGHTFFSFSYLLFHFVNSSHEFS